MRVKNKELRQRRHRKEQVIKDAIREAKKNAGQKAEKKVAPAPAEKPAAKKAPAKKTEAGEKKPAAKKAPAKKAEPKPKAE